MESLPTLIARELSLDPARVERTLELLDGGATVPFVARYRKEATGDLDEVRIGAIAERAAFLRELDARKATVLREIEKQGKLTPELRAKIEATLSKTELEDLYLPYKPKRRTRASIARERGLEPLAERILAQAAVEPPRETLGAPFVSAERGVPDLEAAFAGARDIVAETISERADVRADLRSHALATGLFVSHVAKGKEEEGARFRDWFDHREPARDIRSHRMLAMLRGENEEVLGLRLEVDADRALDLVRRVVVTNPRAALAAELEAALADSWKRLLAPSIENDVRNDARERAEAEAIRVFSENLRNLLLAPPLGGKRVLGVDPGFRTGCKLVAVDEQGDLRDHTVIFPTHSARQVEEAARVVEELCRRHRVEAVAIGNGTAGRETEAFFRRLAKEEKLGGARVVVVNESGASVYSASEVAREELPDQDVTVRGAVSIARRLQDPLAELVKIDPKSIGVGQYQHDVHQPTLHKALDAAVESCVNRVGVDLNTASPTLLRYVAGLGETLARNIVAFRAENGPFPSRRRLAKVPRVGAKAFEQAAGFLRVRGGQNPLDDSAVHPESYDVVERMAQDLGVEPRVLVGNGELAKKIDVARYVDDRRGLPTLRDIIAELEKPGRDPRAEFTDAGFDPDVTEFEHVAEGMLLAGVVTNVTRFGAFVDVGVHQDGLVHVSELSDRFVRDPSEVVKVGDRVKVRVLQVDAARRRIGLSLKQARPVPEGAAAAPSAASPRPQDASRPEPPRADRARAEGARAPTKPPTPPDRAPGRRPAPSPRPPAGALADALLRWKDRAKDPR
ncbi:MAG: RNA-binding transcriptional accessory protein [Deltaproteobacteria bacterium]|nr:RNA-binding transcriptional accessory protein [Deltaproteobacteria bacterium]